MSERRLVWDDDHRGRPPAQRPAVQVLRTDSATFAALLDAQRHRHDDFYKVSSGKVGLCSVDIPVREPKAAH